MAPDLSAAQIYTDFSGFDSLRSGARQQSPEALRAVARQFEALFLQMTLKSMRAASFGDPLFGSDESKFYQGMFDQQLALNLSSRGKGLGLADMIVRQLGGGPLAAPSSDTVTNLPQPVPTPDTMTNPPQPAPTLARIPAQHVVMDKQMQLVPPPASEVPAVAAAATATSSVTPVAAPTAAMVALAPQDLDGSPEGFVQALLPHARTAARELGLPPAALLAQAALETGWGRSVIKRSDGHSSHNLFGIKAHAGWQGARVSVPSLEYVDGALVKQRSEFRAYDSFAASFADYVNFLRSNPRYRDALQQTHDPAAFSQALQDAGYATDPAYARKIMTILGGPTLKSAMAELKDSAGGTIT